MRQKFIVGNWKMHTTAAAASQLAKAIVDGLGMVERVSVAVCPPFPYLALVREVLKGSRIALGAQNLFPEKEGAFTGEVSPTMLLDLGCRYVILGHSERRQFFGETDETVNRKLVSAVAAHLTSIVCIGETLEQRDANETLAVLDRQIKQGLDGLTADQIAALVIAYEPVWAIGTGRNATPAQTGEAHAHIRARVRQWFGGTAADQCHIIYGGSVKPDNIRDLASLADVDGALVGGASLEVRSFFEIVSRSRPSAV